MALKERCKEIRLNLQRRITELQDTLAVARQKYQTEISDLRREYGRDLNSIKTIARERLAMRQTEWETYTEHKLEDLAKENEHKNRELREDIATEQKRAQEAIELADSRVRDAQRDLKKLKNESTGYFKGGWGTFIVAFEDKDFDKGKGHQINTRTFSASTVGRSLKKEKAPLSSHRSGLSSGSHSHVTSTEDLLEGAPHPIEKITHFVEVGFLIDSNDFRLINTFEEPTYDSNLKKYLFEFQDSLQTGQMRSLEFKVKQQLTENLGLFNEIDPVYISLNMGRPSTAFADDYVPQDQFRLIKREGVAIMGSRWMTVSFLKCDYLTQSGPHEVQRQETKLSGQGLGETSSEGGFKQYLLRVIAFENETSSQFTFDLNYEDLLILMHGNIKLLEDESSHDLCQLLLNCLTMIKRDKVDAKGRTVKEDVLIAEHKVFFSEQYRSAYDKKNKNIMAKYDKKRQGLVQDAQLETEFEKSLIYEAFQAVYSDQIQIVCSQGPSDVGVELLRGTMSGNIKLRVCLADEQPKEMCLFANSEGRSHKVCSEVVHIDSRANNGPLAFVISLEKMYGNEGIIVVRLVLVEKWDPNLMSEYSWNPEGRPQEGSTQFFAETLYLVKKNDSLYCRVTEYEILNTEIRSLLFMHSYGYIQANMDFGNVRRYLEHAENRRLTYLSVLGPDQEREDGLNMNIQQPAQIDRFLGLEQLLYRQFYIVRVRTMVEVDNASNGQASIEQE